MLSDDRRFAIVYDGAIYNASSLRRDLHALGHKFTSQSDAEVLLRAYAAWGRHALHRLNGMFAFVIYDAHDRKLFAARDRFGSKPLYIWHCKNQLLALASEIKQLTTLPAFRPRLNPHRAYDFLNYGLTDHTRETLFKRVYQLRGGEFFEYRIESDDGPLHPVRWYELRARPVSGTFADAAMEVRELFLDSVALQMNADVPVGAALSGGIDSSSIVCAADAHLQALGNPATLRTFSACSEVARFDERSYVDKVVAATRVTPHYVYPTVTDLFSNLDTITWHQDEPFSGTSVFAEWTVFRLVASTDVKVTLDGHGADELFAGYPAFFGPRLLESLKTGRLCDFVREAAHLRSRQSYGPTELIGALLNFGLPDPALQTARRAFGRIPHNAKWFRHERFAVSRAPPSAPYFWPSQSVRGYSRAQLLATSLPMQLHWADRDSMAHSIESRTPYLDYRLVEYALGCPPAFKIRDGVTKAVLRESMRDRLPVEIAERRDKMGFVTAEEHWIRKEASDRFRSAIDSAFHAASDVVNEGARDRAIAILEGREQFNLFIWRLISFGHWMRRFSVCA